MTSEQEHPMRCIILGTGGSAPECFTLQGCSNNFKSGEGERGGGKLIKKFMFCYVIYL